MMIQTVRFRKRDGHPKGAAWVIPDDDELARGVAQIALGQWAHLETVLRSSSWANPPVDYSIAGAIKLLAVPADAPQWKISHRDGWLFQAISWIAAVETNRGPSRPPHTGHAEKGFDGLQLLMTRDGTRVKRLVMFEDKATKNPRITIRNEVWPAFRSLESGEHDPAIRSELSSLFSRVPHIDQVEAVNRVMRSNRNRVYRIAVTIEPSQANPSGILRLFKGYADVVPGSRYRRRAHVLAVPDLRAWMDRIASRAVTYLEELA